jgi:hypothetical protein
VLKVEIGAGHPPLFGALLAESLLIAACLMLVHTAYLSLMAFHLVYRFPIERQQWVGLVYVSLTLAYVAHAWLTPREFQGVITQMMDTLRRHRVPSSAVRSNRDQSRALTEAAVSEAVLLRCSAAGRSTRRPRSCRLRPCPHASPTR